MLRGVAVLLERHPELRSTLTVAVVGGPSGSGLERPDSLVRLAEELGIDELVRFVPPVSQDELVDWYAASTLVCVPSYNESFGLVAVEAQATGTPVVAAAVGGLHHRRARRPLRPAGRRPRARRPTPRRSSACCSSPACATGSPRAPRRTPSSSAGTAPPTSMLEVYAARAGEDARRPERPRPAEVRPCEVRLHDRSVTDVDDEQLSPGPEQALAALRQVFDEGELEWSSRSRRPR